MNDDPNYYTSYVYLASPYMNKLETVRDVRFYLAAIAAAYYIEHDRPVYAPIVHSCPIAKYGLSNKDAVELPFSYWEHLDFAMLFNAAALHVLMLPHWDTSVGIAAEIAFAKKLETPTRYIKPETVIPNYTQEFYEGLITNGVPL